MQLFLKILSGKANSADPDQTAPEGAVWSGSALFAYVILTDSLVFEILGHLPYLLEASLRGASNEYSVCMFGYSLEALVWGASNEYSQYMFCGEIGKNIYLIPPLLSRAMPYYTSDQALWLGLWQKCWGACSKHNFTFQAMKKRYFSLVKYFSFVSLQIATQE